ncbi:MAG: leucyl/phenylalanyl-tRNA--protein transferase [Bdellovibrio bacteriovorus]
MIPLLAAQDPHSFPSVDRALRRPNGLLAAGGDLSPERLLSAYRRGIFPWFGEGDPILWWSPDPRTILPPSQIRISRSLRKRLRRRLLGVTMDLSFGEVIRACSAPRDAESAGTWIVPPMIRAYEALHRLGWAHSVEVWQGDRLVGGLYGVALGRVFFGESMFSRVDDASKVALVHLCERLQSWDFGLIDCQMRTDHLISLGALEVPRRQFVSLLDLYCVLPGPSGSWDQGCLQFPQGPAPAARAEDAP